MSLQHFFANAEAFNQDISTWSIPNDEPNQSQQPFAINFSLNPENHQPSGTINLSNLIYTIDVDNDKYNVRSFNVDDIDYSFTHHECSICLIDVNENIIKTICKHYFCKSCMDKWLSEHDNCPNCRNNLLSS